jgi:hypothetical protein
MTGSAETPDNLIDALVADVAPEAAAAALAALINRAAARLHTLSRGQASAHKDAPEWPAWAQLQNASRALVLQASTCRDLAARLPTPASDAEMTGTEPPPPGSTAGPS